MITKKETLKVIAATPCGRNIWTNHTHYRLVAEPGHASHDDEPALYRSEDGEYALYYCQGPEFGYIVPLYER